MALVQPASLQLFQKLAEPMLGSGAAGEQSEASGAETGCRREVPTQGASSRSGGGDKPAPGCGGGLWTQLCSGLGPKQQTGMMAQ